MVIDGPKIVHVLKALNELNYRKHGAKIVIGTGSSLFENKAFMAEHLKLPKASDAERAISKFLENFEDEFAIVGQDMKDGSKKVGVMVLIPYFCKEVGMSLKREGYKIYSYKGALEELARLEKRDKN